MLELIQFLGGAALIVGALVYIAKRVVDGFLQTSVATFKANLEKVATENLIKFKRLHHERADVVRELYRHLTELDLALVSTLSLLTVTDEPLTKKVADIIELHKKFNFYQLNKVFFSVNICARIENLVSASEKVCIAIAMLPADPESDAYKHNDEKLWDRHVCWERARSLHKNEISEIRKEIERDFRNLLGVDV